jgi:tricorn protease-like protein
MIKLHIKAIVMTDGTNYFIHGASDETPPEMFAKMAPIWQFDPQKETVHYVELDVELPDYAGANANTISS